MKNKWSIEASGCLLDQEQVQDFIDALQIMRPLVDDKNSEEIAMIERYEKLAEARDLIENIETK